MMSDRFDTSDPNVTEAPNAHSMAEHHAMLARRNFKTAIQGAIVDQIVRPKDPRQLMWFE